MNNFKFFTENIQDKPLLVSSPRTLTELINKWGPTGLLDDAISLELVAYVMEMTFNRLSSRDDVWLFSVYPVLSRIFKTKQRYYNDEIIRRLIDTIVIDLERSIGMGDRSDEFICDICQQIMEYNDWRE